MSGYLIRMKEVMLRVTRHCGSALDRVVPYLTTLTIALVIIQGSGVRLVVYPAALMIGNMLVVRCGIHLIVKPRVFMPLREVISQRFASWPPLPGFSLMVFLATAAIVAEVILLKNFIHPADSWVFVFLGFLVGIMVSVTGKMGRKSGGREDGGLQECLEAPVWIRYSPLPTQMAHLKRDT